MSITENLHHILSTLPQGVTLVAVSKFHPVEALQEAYAAGQRIFGESREPELRLKYEALPHDIEWHFIGHLQTNKVKYIAPLVRCIQSVDSERLLDEIERQAARFAEARLAAGLPATIDVLLQVHVAAEETKSGFTPAELQTLLASVRPAERWQHLRLCGLMGMATNTDDAAQVRREFDVLAQLHRHLSHDVLPAAGIPATQFATLSMGMSHDYPIAIAAGTTMVRVGTDIFGERQY